MARSTRAILKTKLEPVQSARAFLDGNEQVDEHCTALPIGQAMAPPLSDRRPGIKCRRNN